MKYVAIAIAILVVAAAAWWGYTNYAVQQPQPQVAAETAAAQDVAAELENVIWASGKLVPKQWAGLSPAATGRLRVIHVQEGDWVEPGDILVELENEVLKSQLAIAQAALAEAEAARDKLLAGPTQEELAAAEADVQAAQAALALAQAQLAQAQQAVKTAEAQVSIAQAQYNELASHPTPSERVAAQKEIDVAKAALDQAQAAYNLVKGNPNVGAMPESLALQQATANYEAAKAAYDAVMKGATKAQLAVARAQIDAAQRQVDAAQAEIPAAEAGVAAAEAQLARAQAALDALKRGPTQEDIAIADARVQSAQAALQSAQAQLSQTQVVAPFAGQIGAVLARVGELSTPGVPVVMLGDTRSMQVETTDLRETDVTRLQEGMPVEVTFDALPGQIFRGTINRIAPMSTTEKGSTNYTVEIAVEDLDPSLRWGMTAFVNIEAKR
ncbi:MAG: HlyD family efflux transporter periplasmic adaptor subunit [Caldilineae bacterium]|nr:MAG: HlyD family efflux transporter periplasmic adaptor subunit [Caldilineae bacterium]